VRSGDRETKDEEMGDQGNEVMGRWWDGEIMSKNSHKISDVPHLVIDTTSLT
jgi:hypothetical protein